MYNRKIHFIKKNQKTKFIFSKSYFIAMDYIYLLYAF